jgi:DNA-binding MarR family transcriptional regulator
MTQTPQRLALALNDFLPYRLAVLAEQVSKVAAQIYADRFELTRPEWRVLAALAELGGISATEVSAHSTLDKMSVSRAVTSLESRDLLVRHDDDADRRNKIIDLTPKGRALYQKIVPLILAREAYLLESFSPDDRATLDRLLAALLTRARELEQRG